MINYSNGKNYNTLSNDTMLVEACIFNLSQIGEPVQIFLGLKCVVCVTELFMIMKVSI